MPTPGGGRPSSIPQRPTLTGGRNVPQGSPGASPISLSGSLNGSPVTSASPKAKAKAKAGPASRGSVASQIAARVSQISPGIPSSGRVPGQVRDAVPAAPARLSDAAAAMDGLGSTGWRRRSASRIDVPDALPAEERGSAGSSPRFSAALSEVSASAPLPAFAPSEGGADFGDERGLATFGAIQVAEPEPGPLSFRQETAERETMARLRQENDDLRADAELRRQSEASLKNLSERQARRDSHTLTSIMDAYGAKEEAMNINLARLEEAAAESCQQNHQYLKSLALFEETSAQHCSNYQALELQAQKQEARLEESVERASLNSVQDELREANAEKEASASEISAMRQELTEAKAKAKRDRKSVGGEMELLRSEVAEAMSQLSQVEKQKRNRALRHWSVLTVFLQLQLHQLASETAIGQLRRSASQATTDLRRAHQEQAGMKIVFHWPRMAWRLDSFVAQARRADLLQRAILKRRIPCEDQNKDTPCGGLSSFKAAELGIFEEERGTAGDAIVQEASIISGPRVPSIAVQDPQQGIELQRLETQVAELQSELEEMKRSRTGQIPLTDPTSQLVQDQPSTNILGARHLSSSEKNQGPTSFVPESSSVGSVRSLGARPKMDTDKAMKEIAECASQGAAQVSEMLKALESLAVRHHADAEATDTIARIPIRGEPVQKQSDADCTSPEDEVQCRGTEPELKGQYLPQAEAVSDAQLSELAETLSTTGATCRSAEAEDSCRSRRAAREQNDGGVDTLDLDLDLLAAWAAGDAVDAISGGDRVAVQASEIRELLGCLSAEKEARYAAETACAARDSFLFRLLEREEAARKEERCFLAAVAAECERGMQLGAAEARAAFAQEREDLLKQLAVETAAADSAQQARGEALAELLENGQAMELEAAAVNAAMSNMKLWAKAEETQCRAMEEALLELQEAAMTSWHELPEGCAAAAAVIRQESVARRVAQTAVENVVEQHLQRTQEIAAFREELTEREAELGGEESRRLQNFEAQDAEHWQRRFQA